VAVRGGGESGSRLGGGPAGGRGGAAPPPPPRGEPSRVLEERRGGARPFVWLRRKPPPAAAEGIRALRLPGIGTLPESLRFYPSRELAAHLLGFVGTDDRGLEGVELAHDKVLAGEPGLALAERDA